jgi:hypothetical protein
MYQVTKNINGVYAEATFKTREEALRQATRWFDSMNTDISDLCGSFISRIVSGKNITYRFQKGSLTIRHEK